VNQESIQKMQAWVRIADAAARNGDRVGAKVSEIARLFGRERPRQPATDSWSLRRQSNPPARIERSVAQIARPFK
jgi:hypothetical protein